MPRLHFYIMGLISLAYGVLAMAEYVLISYGLQLGWLANYPPDQIDWLSSLPNWVHGVWGAHSLLALAGALCLITHVRAAVWMLAFAFLTLVVLLVWAVFLAQPTMLALVGGGVMPLVTIGLVLLLSFLIYLYARQEKRQGEVL
ncbi:MAG: hypothetical protein AAFY65_19570 [Pseudomonadota bacterium]